MRLRSRLVLIFATLVLLAVAIPTAFSAERIAVWELESQGGLSAQEAALVTDRLRLEIVQTGCFEVFERGQMNLILEEQGLQQSGACSESECLVEFGKLIGVPRIIGGSVGKIGQSYTINVKLIDVSSGRILAPVIVDCRKCSIEDVTFKSLGDVAKRLCRFAGSRVVSQPKVVSKPKAKPKKKLQKKKTLTKPGPNAPLDDTSPKRRAIGFEYRYNLAFRITGLYRFADILEVRGAVGYGIQYYYGFTPDIDVGLRGILWKGPLGYDIGCGLLPYPEIRGGVLCRIPQGDYVVGMMMFNGSIGVYADTTIPISKRWHIHLHADTQAQNICGGVSVLF